MRQQHKQTVCAVSLAPAGLLDVFCYKYSRALNVPSANANANDDNDAEDADGTGVTGHGEDVIV